MNQFSKEELEEARERNKKSTKYKNGTVWESNNFGKFEIIGKFDAKNFYIRFIDTDSVYIKSCLSVSNGQVKDLYAPNVCNKGFTGDGEYSRKSHQHLYSRWQNMLERCYGDKERNPSYKDVTVDSRWFNFQIFAEDITNMMTEQGIEDLDGYAIDKDIKQTSGAKIYSKDTISIITQSENSKEMNSRRVFDVVYVAVNIETGEEIEFNNQAKFGREHDLTLSSVSMALNGKLKRVGNWIFYKKGEKAPNIEDFRDTVYVAEDIKTGETVEFTNQAQFGREHNIDKSSISRVLKGKQKTSGGFRFYRKED